MGVTHRFIVGELANPARGVSLAGALAVASCAGPPPGPPSAVVLTNPATVCIGDDYRTPITLDGTQSGSALMLIPSPGDAGAPPLQYLWTLAGSAYKVVSGSVTSSKLVVTMAADQPLQVDLRVTNGAGTPADGTATVSVTSLSDGGCPLGNPG
jgi:hypothetical protein